MHSRLLSNIEGVPRFTQSSPCCQYIQIPGKPCRTGTACHPRLATTLKEYAFSSCYLLSRVLRCCGVPAAVQRLKWLLCPCSVHSLCVGEEPLYNTGAAGAFVLTASVACVPELVFRVSVLTHLVFNMLVLMLHKA